MQRYFTGTRDFFPFVFLPSRAFANFTSPVSCPRKDAKRDLFRPSSRSQITNFERERDTGMKGLYYKILWGKHHRISPAKRSRTRSIFNIDASAVTRNKRVDQFARALYLRRDRNCQGRERSLTAYFAQSSGIIARLKCIEGNVVSYIED